jgi:hypothetical protein
MPAVPPAAPTNGTATPWTPLGGQGAGTWRRTGAPDPTADPDRWVASNGGPFATSDTSSGTGRIAPLDAGTLLKGSRYRLQRRFSAPSLAGQQNDTEPPLFAASDAEQPSSRVLVQELPIADLNPALADQIHRRVTARLEMFGQHPAIPQLIDMFAERRRRFLVFAMPDGQLLTEYRQASGTLSEPAAVRMATHLLDALMQLEQAVPPIVHGNIAPGNIIVRPDGMPVLVGFSASLLAQGGGSGQVGEAGGARGFAAPEQLRGLADARTDVFSLAAVLHWAVTGRDPQEAIGGAVEPARRINPAVTRDFDGVLTRALHPDPARRFPSAGEMRRTIATLLEPALDLDDPLEGGRSGRHKKPRKPPRAPKAPRTPKAPKAPRVSKAERAVKGGKPPPAAQFERVPAAPQPAQRSARARDIEQTKTRTMLPGAVGALRAALEEQPKPRKRRRHSAALLLLLILLVLAGLVADGYVYLVHIHSPLLQVLPHIPFIHP